MYKDSCFSEGFRRKIARRGCIDATATKAVRVGCLAVKAAVKTNYTRRKLGKLKRLNAYGMLYEKAAVEVTVLNLMAVTKLHVVLWWRPIDACGLLQCCTAEVSGSV